MNRFLWVLFLACAALVFGSWLGWVPGVVSWPAWCVGMVIAAVLRAGWRESRSKLPPAEPMLRLTGEERERARWELDGDPPR